MDGKVPETMHFCNKNVPKALNSSTPEVFNHLVRTERRAHAEIIPSSMGRILLQTPGKFPIFSTFTAYFNLPLLV
jgi:hypothetical protein